MLFSKIRREFSFPPTASPHPPQILMPKDSKSGNTPSPQFLLIPHPPPHLSLVGSGRDVFGPVPGAWQPGERESLLSAQRERLAEHTPPLPLELFLCMFLGQGGSICEILRVEGTGRSVSPALVPKLEWPFVSVLGGVYHQEDPTD